MDNVKVSRCSAVPWSHYRIKSGTYGNIEIAVGNTVNKRT